MLHSITLDRGGCDMFLGNSNAWIADGLPRRFASAGSGSLRVFGFLKSFWGRVVTLISS